MATSEKTTKALQECIFLVSQGVTRFGSHEELARRMCHGRDNSLLANRLKQMGDERPNDMGLAGLLTLKDQLIAALQ